MRPRTTLCLGALLALCILSFSAGCAKKKLAGYERAPAVSAASKAAQPQPARGYVNVVCREGVSSDRGEEDTLFGCLLHARENGEGVVDLPPGLYLGHVSEFIVRSLRYYDLEGRFERYYGTRIILRLREANAEEKRRRQYGPYYRLALGTGAEMAVWAATSAAVPLSPVIFLWECAAADREKAVIAEAAEAKGLPEPDIGGGEAVVKVYGLACRRVMRHVGSAVQGSEPDPFEETLDGYVVEECRLLPPDEGDDVVIVEAMH